MRFLIVTLISLSCLRAVASPEAGQEILFCPGDVARTYPLDSRGRVQSLLAPHIAVINHAAMPLTLNEVYLELLRGGEVYTRAIWAPRTWSDSPAAVWHPKRRCRWRRSSSVAPI
jgi:hypothetical protein